MTEEREGVRVPQHPIPSTPASRITARERQESVPVRARMLGSQVSGIGVAIVPRAC
jgi:hypothetical protein